MTDRACAPRTRVAAATLAAALLVAACSTEPVVPKCSRHDAASMGPENAFRVSVADPAAPVLQGDRDHLDVAFSIVPPVDGPIVLVHTDTAGETSRWVLEITHGVGLSTRCRLGSTPAQSTCGATIGTLPHPTSGSWTIEAGRNRALEVGIAIRTCR